jgi:hypothetical protein
VNKHESTGLAVELLLAHIDKRALQKGCMGQQAVVQSSKDPEMTGICRLWSVPRGTINFLKRYRCNMKVQSFTGKRFYEDYSIRCVLSMFTLPYSNGGRQMDHNCLNFLADI